MKKTDRMLLLEERLGKPVNELIRRALAKHRGEPRQVTRAAEDLDLTDSTIYGWCRELGIDILDYRRSLSPKSGNGALAGTKQGRR